MHEHDGYAPHSHEVRADHGGVKRLCTSEAIPAGPLVHDLAIVLRGCLDPSAEVGPSARLAASRIRDVLGITPGELTAGIEDKLTALLAKREAGE